MSDKKKTSSRGELLKQLREEHAETFQQTQHLLKRQKFVQQEICRVIRENPKTVPEIAEAINMPANEVLWYVASFRKYGLLVEKDMCGDYPLYQKAEEE